MDPRTDHLYYSLSSFGSRHSAIGDATAGPWTDHGAVLRTTEASSYNAIDPELIVDAEGRPWLAFGSFWDGIKLTRLDPATMRPTGGLTSLARRSGAIEAASVRLRRHRRRRAEAAHQRPPAGCRGMAHLLTAVRPRATRPTAPSGRTGES